MKSADKIPGWVIWDFENAQPCAWFRTREEARKAAKESGLSAGCVMRESES